VRYPIEHRVALGNVVHMEEVKDLVKALRARLALSQESLEAASGGHLAREAVSKIEAGKNKCTSYALRDALARGFGIDFEVLVAYLDGRATIEDVVAHRVARVPGNANPAKPSRRLNDRDDWETATAEARRIAPWVSGEMFARIGIFVDHHLLPEPTDPKAVADIADALFKSSFRERVEPDVAQRSAVQSSTKKRPGR